MVTWVRGLRESKYLLRGSTFYVGHNFYVGCVGQTFLRGLRGSNIFLRGSLRGLILFFAWVIFIY